MKHAKRLLAVVMVLAMVAAFSAIAFAATPSASFTVSDYADGKATVTVKFVGAVGLTSGSLNFSYPKDKVTSIVKKKGADEKAIGDIDNGFSSEFNGTANPAEFGFYFKNNLWSSEEWKAAAEALDQEDYVNGESFECAQFVFTAESGTVITVSGELKIGDAATPVSTSFTIGAAKVDETTTAKQPDKTETTTEKKDDKTETTTEKKDDKVETTTEKKPDKVETTTAKNVPSDGSKYDKYGNKILGYDKNGQAIIGYANGQPIYSQDKSAHKSVILDVGSNNNGKDFVGGKTDGKADDKCTTAKAGKAAASVKTDGGKKTGDNSILAVVAGMVALAGAAFVVTKKRK